MSEQRMYPGMSPDEKTTFAPYSAFDIPADLRELSGRYDVEAMALRCRNFRYAEEWLMMMLGGWVATIPEPTAGVLQITALLSLACLRRRLN